MNESKPPITWNSLVVTYLGAHILQANEWGQFKGRYGWQPLHIIWNEQIYRIIDPTISPSYNAYTVGPERPVAVAQVLRRNATIYGLDTHFCILYVPKGPLLDWTNAALCRRVLSDLARIAQ